jgi:hypothetical protein
MAGTISLSLSQQFNAQGAPLAGGRLYFFQAGTTTPQSAYQDSGLIIPHANPIILDAAGRVPQFFLADGSIKIRLASESGVTQIAADGILVIGPSSGGGGGSPVDATTVLQTGDLKVRYGTGVHTGWVRANGRTIGSATSGATERANADTEALFLYLWGADANLFVSGGRGANAAADWTANKTIALPDWRGCALGALADMGNSATSVLTSTFFGTSPIVLGAAGGAQGRTIDQTYLPGVSYALAGFGQVVGLSVPSLLAGGAVTATVTGGSNQGGVAIGQSHVNPTVSFTPTGSIGPLGSGTTFPTTSPMKLATIYIKL